MLEPGQLELRMSADGRFVIEGGEYNDAVLQQLATVGRIPGGAGRVQTVARSGRRRDRGGPAPARRPDDGGAHERPRSRERRPLPDRAYASGSAGAAPRDRDRLARRALDARSPARTRRVDAGRSLGGGTPRKPMPQVPSRRRSDASATPSARKSATSLPRRSPERRSDSRTYGHEASTSCSSSGRPGASRADWRSRT